MAKVENKKAEAKKDKTVSIHEIGAHNDTIKNIGILAFKDSDDRGFEFQTSNLKLVLRAKKEDYYSLIETLFSDVYDEFQDSDNYNPLIDDFRDFLIAKMNGDV
jgi:hypothetical protein